MTGEVGFGGLSWSFCLVVSLVFFWFGGWSVGWLDGWMVVKLLIQNNI